MNLTKLLTLTSILILSTSCELKVDDGDGNSNSKMDVSEIASEIVHNSAECPKIKGTYQQEDSENATDYEADSLELIVAGDEVLYRFEGTNEDLIVDGQVHTFLASAGKLKYAAACKDKKLYIYSMVNGERFNSVTWTLPNGDLRQQIQYDEADETFEEEYNLIKL